MNFIIRILHRGSFPAFLFALILAITGCTEGVPLHPWEDPEINSIGEERWRSWFIPLSNREQVFHRQEESDWCISLNGVWNFLWSEDFDDRPADFYLDSFETKVWEKIPVPMSWQMAGYGTHVFKNSGFIASKQHFPKVEPSATQGRPVGSYVKYFTCPENWEGREVYINFLGVESAFRVWVNGQELGYSEDSRTTAEFRLTPWLREGENKLAVEVYRLSDGVFLEDWDAWRMSGIYRDVFLIAKSRFHIKDFFVKTYLINDYQSGLLSVDLEYSQSDPVEQRPERVQLLVYDSRKRFIARLIQEFNPTAGMQDAQNICIQISRPKLWSAEFPNLYYAIIELVDAEGTVLERVGTHAGFREIDIVDGQLLINKKPALILGVNRIDHDPQFGKYVSDELQVKDIALMKQHNINAIRTAHCPSDPNMYELCDRYGIYVIDEANIESHGFGTMTDNILANDPVWEQAHLERLEAMMQRDKNYPSVIMWSLGNEAGSGSNFYSMNAFAHELDDTRPTHYHVLEENVNSDILGGSNRNAADGEELYGMHRYLTPDELEYIAQFEDARPYLLNEYIHASGTSVANLKAYVDLFETCPRLAGGCIWDWVDQGIYNQNEKDQFFFACGYDFDEKFTANCNDGLVLPDRTGMAKLAEVKACYQRIEFSFSPDKPKVIGLVNKYNYDDLSSKYLSWKILKDGYFLEGGRVEDIRILPGDKKYFELPLTTSLSDAAEYILITEVKNAESCLWAEKGFTVAMQSFAITDFTCEVNCGGDGTDRHTITESPNELIIQHGNHRVFFDKKTGMPAAFLEGDDTLFRKGPEPCFYRAPTQGDGNRKFGRYNNIAREWKEKALDNPTQELKKFWFEEQGDSLLVYTACQILFNAGKAGFDVDLQYIFYPNTAFKIDYKVKSFGEMPEFLPRIGLQLSISPDFESFRWYGNGPENSYSDRKSGVLPGIYSVLTGSDWIAHMKPQENNNKTDLRWIELEQLNGRKIRISADSLFEGSVSPYAISDIEKALHQHELRKLHYPVLHLDVRNGPVGNNSCCGGKLSPLPEYRILPGVYERSFRFQILSSASIPSE